jgi:TPR repeat protein
MKLRFSILMIGLAPFLFIQTLFAQSALDTNKLAEIRAKAAEGDAQAQCELGSAYAFGKLGLKSDWANAMVWFQKSAAQSNAEAECRLGTGYGFGVGLPENLPEAVRWYHKSADRNFVEAYWRLGCCYLGGQGVPRDDAEGIKYFLKAAEQNYLPAYQDLGTAYSQGRGVDKDLVEAYKWNLLADKFSHSRDHSLGEWSNFMKSQKKELSSEQVEEATRRMNEWCVQHKLIPKEI